MPPSPEHWLVLILQVPSKPDYLRVKVRRRLTRINALPLRDSVYLLPYSPVAMEDARWLEREVAAAGGRVLVMGANTIAGVTDAELTKAVASGHFDFERASKAPPSVRVRVTDYRGRTWITRTDVHSDRIASAWLIRRFIDPSAKFKFVDGDGYRPRPRDVRFDMFAAEFTHEGDHCSFETLVARFGLKDHALLAVAQVVHDIDLKDGRFGRPETPGIAQLIDGICRTSSRDAERLQLGAAVFDHLYAARKRTRP